MNHPLYKIANAQLENSADLREGQRGAGIRRGIAG